MTTPGAIEAVPRPLRIVVLGLTISSSWGNGHATTYRALLRELGRAGHDVWFLERDKPWYASERDCPEPEGCTLVLYDSLQELERRATELVRHADAVVVGSYVPQGVEVADWALRTAHGVVAFYDIDTPVTLAKLDRGDEEYLNAALIPRFDLYLSFTGGPLLARLERAYGARDARPLYCAVDESHYRPPATDGTPLSTSTRWDLGYLGTYSADRQPGLERLLLTCARALPDQRFVVAGPGYPPQRWPGNVERIDHLPPADHPSFYGGQRFTLNLTRADMIQAGYSPSVRLFEAAACGTPIVSDVWQGIEQFFEPGKEILLAHSDQDVRAYLEDLPEGERAAIGQRARERVLQEHTATRRAATLEGYLRAKIGHANGHLQEDIRG